MGEGCSETDWQRKQAWDIVGDGAGVGRAWSRRFQIIHFFWWWMGNGWL